MNTRDTDNTDFIVIAKKARKLKNARKATALILSIALLLGLAPVLPGIDTKARAEELGPSVDAYATKDELMTEFIPEAADGPGTRALLKFGRKDNDDLQEWFVLGKDSKSGDSNNIAIFATSSMFSSYFQDKDATLKYNSSDEAVGRMDYEGTEPSDGTVMLLNNYGMSLIRQELRERACDPDCFDC